MDVAAARLFRVGAIAMASRSANAVGTVRLGCAPEGLSIDLLQVGRFAVGFALLGVAQPVSFRVPYTAVRSLVRVGPVLHLSLDATVAKPYHRFSLCHFSDEPHSGLMRAFRVRAAARLLRLALPVPLAGLAAWQLPSAWVGGVLGLGAVGLLVAALAWLGLGRLVDWLTAGGPGAAELRDTFERVLGHYLGLEPLGLENASAPSPDHALGQELGLGPALRGAWGTVSRPRTFAVVCALAVLAGLGSLLAVGRFGVVARVVLPVDEGRAGAAGPVRRLFETIVAQAAPRHEICRCTRALSSLLSGEMPVLSILVAPRRGVVDQLWLVPGETVPIGQAAQAARPAEPSAAEATPSEPPHEKSAGRPRKHKRARTHGPSPEVDLDVAVVNNGAQSLHDVSLVLTFAQRTADGRRTAVMERGLSWAGELPPAGSVKWRVEAEGTELRVDTRFTDKLGAVRLADAGAFRGLLKARLGVVRVHAAMLLDYLGEPGARQIAEALGPQDGVAEEVRGEILRTFAPLRACDAQPGPDRLSVCAYNGSAELLRAVVVSERGVPSPRRWPVADLIRPSQGIRVELPLGGLAPPERLDVVAGAEPAPSSP
jgi:hypothetical protein